MAALTANRVTLMPNGTIRKISLPLAVGVQCFIGSVLAFDSGNVGAVYPMVGGNANMTPIGTALEAKNNIGGTGPMPVGIELSKEVELIYLDNDTGGGALTVANSLGATVYSKDDHTVTITAGTNSKAGRVWIVNAAGTGQIGVQFPA